MTTVEKIRQQLVELEQMRLSLEENIETYVRDLPSSHDSSPTIKDLAVNSANLQSAVQNLYSVFCSVS